MFNRKLVWQKYVDPFSGGLDSVEWPGAIGLNNDCDFHPNFLKQDIAHDVGLAMDDDDDDDDEDDYKALEARGKPHSLNVLSTPMGFIPLTDSNMPSKCFDLWVGHTNFSISQEVVRIIEAVPGVEILNVFSKYRFLVGFGKLFKNALVMHDIAKVLSIKSETYQLVPELQSKLDNLKEKISKYNFWAILMTPNGQFHTVYSNNKDTYFEMEYANCCSAYRLVGGVLLSYET